MTHFVPDSKRMSLYSCDTWLDSYEIAAPLGTRGVAEVYHARHGKLKRDVAIRVLPDFWKRDPKRL